ncbi:MAG: DUF1553 domain-containing protein [Gemmataceae bacterium]
MTAKQEWRSSTCSDAANPTDCYRRAASVRPQQGARLSNSELTPRMARRLAARLAGEADPVAFVHAAFESVLARSPSNEELAVATGFLARQEASASPRLRFVAGVPRDDAPVARPSRPRPENLLIALFNHTDFVTLR